MGAYIRCCVNKYKYEQVFGNAKSCGKTDDSLRKKKAALGSKSGVDYAARRRRAVRADGVRGIERRSGGGNDIRVYLKRSENKSVAADFRGGNFTLPQRSEGRSYSDADSVLHGGQSAVNRNMLSPTGLSTAKRQ